MRAHLVQLDIAWQDPSANYARVEDLLDRVDVAPGDFVLLPEMFDTGFSMQTEVTADRGGTLEFLSQLSADFKAIVQGGRTVHDCGCAKASNVMSVVGPPAGAGEGREARLLCQYAKIHPFSLGGEHERFQRGARVEVYGWASGDDQMKVCPAICYDLRFPELFRRGLAMGAEMFALGACWLKTRHQHWKPLLVARAIENQAYVLGVNRVGRDPNAEYLGGTVAIDPMGEVIGELSDAEGVLSVEIEPRRVRAWREKFPAWRDGRLSIGG